MPMITTNTMKAIWRSSEYMASDRRGQKLPDCIENVHDLSIMTHEPFLQFVKLGAELLVQGQRLAE